MHVASFASEHYPSALHGLKNGPGQLFMIGQSSHLLQPAVAIVGTREATPYGIRTTRALASAFARAGVSIISGMARGIDAAAHRAALEVGGRTVAVLGTGVDVPYPAGHRELHRILGERALVVSEYGPGVNARPGTFPRRNRIIAALASVTIVVEAGHRSGALITAEHASILERKVAAVPGPIDSSQSEGTNQLIRDGAHMIASIADALSLVNIALPEEREPAQLSDEEARVWKALASGPQTPDALAVRCHFTTRQCLGFITSLEVQGLVESLVSGEVRRR